MDANALYKSKIEEYRTVAKPGMVDDSDKAAIYSACITTAAICTRLDELIRIFNAADQL